VLSFLIHLRGLQEFPQLHQQEVAKGRSPTFQLVSLWLMSSIIDFHQRFGYTYHCKHIYSIDRPRIIFTMASPDRRAFQQLLAKLQAQPTQTRNTGRINAFNTRPEEYCLCCQSFAKVLAKCQHCNGPYCSECLNFFHFRCYCFSLSGLLS
jgi:hypothetical protein